MKIISALLASLFLVVVAAAADSKVKQQRKQTLRELLRSEAVQNFLKERNLQTIDDITSVTVDYNACSYGGAEPCGGFNTKTLLDAFLTFAPQDYIATFQYPEAASGSTVSCTLDCNTDGDVTLSVAFGSLASILTGGIATNTTTYCPVTISASTATQDVFYAVAYGATTTAINRGFLNCFGTAAKFAPWALGYAQPLATRYFSSGGDFGGRRHLTKYVRGSSE